MIKRRPLKRIGTVAGVLSAAILLTVTQASAASAEIERATATTGPANGDGWECAPHYSDQRAQVCYEDIGDWFEILDGEPDGYSAVAQWETISPQGKVTRWGYIYNASGAATTRFKNKDFDETNSIRFRACLGHWTTKLIDADKCSAWRSMDT